MRNIIIICILLCSCHLKREQLTPIGILPQKTFTELGDSTFFSAISGMYHQDGKIYLSELSRGEILVLNENYSLCDIIGKKGKGPGEFVFNGHILVDSDSIFIVNGNGVSLFVNKHFVNNIPENSIYLNSKLIGAFDLRFAYNNGNLYYFPLSDQPEILKYNIHMQENNIFALSNFKDVNHKNRGHVVCDGNNLYVILQNVPYVEKFALTGEQKEVFDYSKKIEYMKTFKYIEAQEKQNNTISTLVRDVSYSNDHLYLLLYLRDYSENLIANNVLVINTKDKSDMKLYHLDDGGYFTLTSCKDGIFLFDIKNAELKLYDL